MGRERKWGQKKQEAWLSHIHQAPFTVLSGMVLGPMGYKDEQDMVPHVPKEATACRDTKNKDGTWEILTGVHRAKTPEFPSPDGSSRHPWGEKQGGPGLQE